MSAIEDAKLLGWVRKEADEMWDGRRWEDPAAPTDVVRVAENPDGTWEWWDGQYFVRAIPAEESALTAALDATPNARRLVEALRKVERLKADATQERDALWGQIADRDRVVATLRADAEKWRAIEPLARDLKAAFDADRGLTYERVRNALAIAVIAMFAREAGEEGSNE